MPHHIPSLTGATAEDAKWLRFAAQLAVRGNHTGRSFLASVEGFQRDRGRELPAVVRAAARDIARCSPDADAHAVGRTLVLRARMVEARA